MNNKKRNIRAILLFIVAVLLIWLGVPWFWEAGHAKMKHEIRTREDIIRKAYLILDSNDMSSSGFDSHIISELKKLGFEEVKLNSSLASCFVSFQKKADSWIYITWEEKDSEKGMIKRMKFKEAFVAIFPIRQFIAFFRKDGYSSHIDVDKNIWEQDKEKQREYFEAKILSTLKKLYEGFDPAIITGNVADSNAGVDTPKK